MQLRNKIQSRATLAITSHNFNGIINVAPRVGKSKIVCDALNKHKRKKFLIVAPYNTILDSWKDEFIKWEVNEDKITIMNQRSLVKTDLKDFNVIICDEIHTLSEVQIEKLTEFNGPILGLTGSLGRESKKILRDELGLEPIFTYSIEEAIRDNIVADYRIFLVPVMLDNKNKYIEAGTKQKKFFTTEYANYQFLTGQFERFKKMSWGNPKFNNIKMQFASKRANLIYNAKSKIEAVQKIIADHPRCLIFTGRTEVADSLAQGYHSKSTEDWLEKFKDGEVNKLAVCEMTNMGVTIPDLKVGIFHQMKSSDESAIQKVMRMCNVEDDEIAKIYITYFAGTVDEEWVRKALTGLDENKITILNQF